MSVTRAARPKAYAGSPTHERPGPRPTPARLRRRRRGTGVDCRRSTVYSSRPSKRSAAVRMTYTIIAIVVLVVVVLFVLISRRSSGGETQTPEKPTSLPRPQAKVAGPARERPTPKQNPTKRRQEQRPRRRPQPQATQLARREAGPTRPPPPRDLSVWRKGLAKARGDGGFLGRLATLFAGKKEIDPAIVDQMEEVLLTSDVGVKTTQAILERLRDGLGEERAAKLAGGLGRASRRGHTHPRHRRRKASPSRTSPTVVLMVGVNGVGKTTTIGKLATKFKGEGKKVAARRRRHLPRGRRAAARGVGQARRLRGREGQGRRGSGRGDLRRDQEGARRRASTSCSPTPPAACTPRRNLMDELKKVAAHHARRRWRARRTRPCSCSTRPPVRTRSRRRQMFKEALPLTGIVLTKLDGTAKGGVILGICDELKTPGALRRPRRARRRPARVRRRRVRRGAVRQRAREEARGSPLSVEASATRGAMQRVADFVVDIRNLRVI